MRKSICTIIALSLEVVVLVACLSCKKPAPVAPESAPTTQDIPLQRPPTAAPTPTSDKPKYSANQKARFDKFMKDTVHDRDMYLEWTDCAGLLEKCVGKKKNDPIYEKVARVLGFHYQFTTAEIADLIEGRISEEIKYKLGVGAMKAKNMAAEKQSYYDRMLQWFQQDPEVMLRSVAQIHREVYGK